MTHYRPITPLPKDATERVTVRNLLAVNRPIFDEISGDISGKIVRGKRAGEEINKDASLHGQLQAWRRALGLFASSGEVDLGILMEGQDLLGKLVHDQQDLIQTITEQQPHGDLSPMIQRNIAIRDSLMTFQSTLAPIVNSLKARQQEFGGHDEGLVL